MKKKKQNKLLFVSFGLLLILFVSLFYNFNYHFQIDELAESLENISSSYIFLWNNYTQCNNSYQNISIEFQNYKNESEYKILNLTSEMDELNERMQRGLINPTYDEVMRLLKEDKTDEKEWRKNEYMCCQISGDVINTFFNQGYLAGLVILTFAGEDSDGFNLSHCLVVFNTVDKGLVFIEPSNDEVMEVNVGGYYWSGNGYAPSYDDFIKRVDIIL